MSQMRRDRESEVTEEQGTKASGRVVAKVQVGSEWLVVTVPPRADEDEAPEGDEEEVESSPDATTDQ